jgi:hypothetical protein
VGQRESSDAGSICGPGSRFAVVAWAKTPVRAPFELAANIPADGLYGKYQADTITIAGDWVAVHGALSGGDPGVPHTSTRSLLEIDRATKKVRRSLSTLSDPLLIETSCGNWPILLGDRRWIIFESGLPGTSGLALWHATTGALLAERPGQFGMLAVDAKRNRLWCARQDWHRPGEDTFVQFSGERGLGPSDALVAFSLPELKQVHACEGFNAPAFLQEPPLINSELGLIVWLTERNGVRQVVAFDADTAAEKWSTPVEPWYKRRDCPYYRQQFASQLAASGSVIVYAGRGLTFLDATNGRVLQRVDDGLYFQPVFAQGELWVLRCYGNLIEERIPSNTTEAAPEGWVERWRGSTRFFLRYDSDPPPPLYAPKGHSAWHCGGHTVEVYQTAPAGDPIPGVQIGGTVTDSDGRYSVEKAESDWIFDPQIVERTASCTVDFVGVAIGDVVAEDHP